MEPVTIWHNPSCSKSRGALTELAELGERAELDAELVVRKYRDDPPAPAELADVLAKAGLEPWEACRTGEAEYRDLAMESWPRQASERDRWIEAMSANPRLIERPIVIRGDHAVIARKPGWQSILAD